MVRQGQVLHCEITPSHSVFMCSCICLCTWLVFACECGHPAISATQCERGRTRLPLADLPCPRFPAPSPPARPRISWWSPHSAYSLSSLCVSLPVPYSSATSAFGLFGQESPPPAAYNNKPTLVTISECVWLPKCVCVYVRGHKKQKYLWGNGGGRV